MAQAKVSQEALVKLAETLRQGAEGIMSAKAEMDSQLRSFVWDDPTGYYFTGKYEEDFKPLTKKLIPIIEEYVSYIGGLEGSVAEYSDVATALGVGSLGTVAGAFAGAVDLRPRSERKGLGQIVKESRANEERRKAEKVLPYIYESNNGAKGIVWNDAHLKKIEQENYDYLKSKEGKEMLKKASNAFSGINDLSSLTKGQLHSIVGGTLGLKREDIIYKNKSIPNSHPSHITYGMHPWDSKEAILNSDQKANMPICQQIATFAHEGRHVYQDIVINSQQNDQYAKEMRKAKGSYKEDIKTFEGYWNNDLEKDARKIELIVGKACVEHYNQLVKDGKIQPRT